MYSSMVYCTVMETMFCSLYMASRQLDSLKISSIAIDSERVDLSTVCNFRVQVYSLFVSNGI